MTTLSLIMPCYNEEATLADIIAHVFGIETADLQVELVLVDDCSKDKSYEIAQDLAQKYPRLKVLKHDVNQGKGAALRTGFLNATGDYVGIQDADMEYTPEDYKIMLEPLMAGNADVVYGSRYLKPDTRRVLSFWHTLMNKMLTVCSNMCTGLDISDMETCYKLFRREVIQKIAPQLKENRFGFEPEITAYVAQGKYRVYESAIHYNPRTAAEGKKIGSKDGIRALYCILHYGAHAAPLPMQFLLYLFIGGLSAIVNIVLFSILLACSVSAFYAVGIAFVAAAAVNYWLCISVLFQHKSKWSTGGEVCAYLVALAFMGLADYGFTFGFAAIGLGIVWSKAWSSLIGLIGNFAFRKYLVFPEKKQRS